MGTVARQTKQTEIHKQTYANRNANKQKQTNTHRAHTEREGREEKSRERSAEERCKRQREKRGRGGENSIRAAISNTIHKINCIAWGLSTVYLLTTMFRYEAQLEARRGATQRGAWLRQMQHIVCPANAKRYCANVDCAQVWQHATPKRKNVKQRKQKQENLWLPGNRICTHTQRHTCHTHTETDKLCVFVVCKYI